MTLWERLTGTKPIRDDSVIRLLIAELIEARKDAVRMAETSAATVDRIVTARYERPDTSSRERNADRSPIAAESALDDDAAWLKTAGIVTDPER